MRRPSVADRELFSMLKLVKGAIIRQHVDLEWLQKVSAKDFKKWQKANRYYYELAGHSETEVQELLAKDIEKNEKLYKLFLLQELEKLNISGVLSADNGLPKHEGKDICLGGELVSFDMAGSPSVSGAILTGTTKPNKNGRIYSADLFDLKDRYDAEWEHGKLDHSNVVRWNRYEKHVKRYGI